jgi:dienelactone hydrolase
MATSVLLTVVYLAFAQGQTFPAKGDNGEVGGIFGMGPGGFPKLGGDFPKGFPKLPEGFPKLGGDFPKGFPKLPEGFPKLPGGIPGMAQGPEFPKLGPRLTNGGSGPYKAAFVTDASLPNHTIYAPSSPPPANVKMPVIVWGNGGCMSFGTMMEDFLTEIASYGYLILANGKPGVATPGSNPFEDVEKAMGGGQTTVSMLTDSVDWVTKGSGAKYGNIDTTKIAAAGQSCGGLEAYSASYHDNRIKLTVLFNSGVIDEKKTYLLKELKAPVGYFLGGPLDIAYENVRCHELMIVTIFTDINQLG